MPRLGQHCFAVLWHICNAQMALVKKSMLYVWRMKQPQIMWYCKERFRGYFPVCFCSFFSLSRHMFMNQCSRERFQVWWEDKKSSQADKVEEKGLSRIGRELAAETGGDPGDQQALCAQVMNVLIFLCGNWTFGWTALQTWECRERVIDGRDPSVTWWGCTRVLLSYSPWLSQHLWPSHTAKG